MEERLELGSGDYSVSSPQTSWPSQSTTTLSPASNSSRLSKLSLVLLYGTSLLVAAAVWENYTNAAYLAIITLPPGFLFYFIYWRHCRRLVSLDVVVKMFYLGMGPGIILTTVLEGFATALFGAIFLYDQLPDLWKDFQQSKTTADGNFTSLIDRIQLKHTVGFFFFLFVQSYVVAALIEEGVKGVLVRFPSQPPRPLRLSSVLSSSRTEGHLKTFFSFLAAGCGFAVLENIGFSAGASSLGTKCFTAALRGVTSLPLHCLCASLTAVGFIKGDMTHEPKSLWKVLFPAVLLHGTFDFAVFLSSGIFGHSDIAEFVVGVETFATLVGGFLWLYRELRECNLLGALQGRPLYQPVFMGSFVPQTSGPPVSTRMVDSAVSLEAEV